MSSLSFFYLIPQELVSSVEIKVKMREALNFQLAYQVLLVCRQIAKLLVLSCYCKLNSKQQAVFKLTLFFLEML